MEIRSRRLGFQRSGILTATVPPQVKVLLEQGAKINAVNKQGDTAVDLAMARGHDAVVRVDSGFGARRATGM